MANQFGTLAHAERNLAARVDPLIEERAPWLSKPGPHIRAIRGLLHLMLGYDYTIRKGSELVDLPTPEMMDRLCDWFAQNVEVSGLG